MTDLSADIVFDKVTKIFPSSQSPTLDALEFKVMPGEIAVLIGFSGTGKSVTLKHVLGLMEPTSGRVLIKGQDVGAVDKAGLYELRKNFGVLFQGSALFDSLNVFENVAFPLREHRGDWPEEKIEGRVRELLKMVDLVGADLKMPSELSGGMQKRVGLARAIALEPKILLFDEPTTGLDPVTSQLIDELIVRTVRDLKASALIISHDIHAALRIADFVSMIWKGKIIERATPNELLKSSQEVVRRFLKSAGAIS